MAESSPPDVDIQVESELWTARPEAQTIVRGAIMAAARARASSRRAGEVSVVLSDDDRIRDLNRDWRGIDQPTNVLSFPARPLPGRRDRAPALLGDIVIAYETTEREACAEGKPFAHHLAHLAVHGFLHLLGYDHDSDEEAEAMERLEADILARLRVPDPYLTRAHEA